MRRSVLQPQLYAEFSNALNQASPCNNAAADVSKQLFKGDVTPGSTAGALGEWDSSKMLFGSGQTYGGTIGSELFGTAPPPPPLFSGNSLLNGGNVSAGDNVFANNFRKTAAPTMQRCASTPKSTSAPSMTSASMAGAHNGGLSSGSVDDAFLDAHHKMMKIAKTRLKQQQSARRSAFLSSSNGSCVAPSLATPPSSTQAS